MNNGLHGRYLAQLEAWNEAREIAADLVEAFHKDTLTDAMSRWNNVVSFPSISKIKNLLMEVLFLDGDETINKLARTIKEWDEPETAAEGGHPAMAA